MILPYQDLMRKGPQVLDPFDPEAVGPASIDLRLSSVFLLLEHERRTHIDLRSVPVAHTRRVRAGADGFVLHPGEFVLGSTIECVRVPENMVVRIEGKSSLGRLGLVVHATAGFVDPGFQGVLTLEMTNWLRVPIVLRPGEHVCQVSFQQLYARTERPYRGRYQGDMGPAASRFGMRRDEDARG